MIDALRAARAPADLLAWVEEVGPDDAWDGCDRPHWLTWMATCRGFPVGAVLSAAIGATLAAGEAIAGAPPVIDEAEAALVAPHEVEDLAAVADACERLADDGPRSYREAIPPTLARYGAALALLLRAEEGLRASLASAQSQADLDAMFRATGVGVPPSIMSRTIRDLVFDPHRHTPTHQTLAFVVDATGEALLLAARIHGEEPAAIEEAEGRLTDRLFEYLDDT